MSPEGLGLVDQGHGPERAGTQKGKGQGTGLQACCVPSVTPSFWQDGLGRQQQWGEVATEVTPGAWPWLSVAGQHVLSGEE